MSGIEGDGKIRGIEDTSREVALDCPCSSKLFKVMVVPISEIKGAAIIKMRCAQCATEWIVNEHGVVGDKSPKFQDHQGKNHHRLICEPGKYDFRDKPN